MHTPTLRSPVVADLAVLLLTLAAPLLGAGNLLWPKALLLTGGALVWLATPPARPLPWRITICFLLLGLTGFLSLLPAGWFAMPPWRGELQALGVGFPGTNSPQPWLTSEKAVLFAGGLAWAWYLLGRNWQMPRRVLLGLYCAGVLGITVWSLVIYASGRGLVLNDGTKVFGIFPNRNQMGNLCALGAILMLALGMEALINRRRAALLWFAACGVTVGGVLLTGSRAAVVLFGLGAFAWLVWASRLLRRPKWIALAVSCLFLLAGAMFAFQSRLIERFKPLAQAVAADRMDFRLLIHRDAGPLLAQSSWHGVGFGNFDPLFAQYRDASTNPSRAIHPESDWLWLAIEAGLPAVALALGLVVMLLRHAWPFAANTDRALRSAAWVCSLLFVLHGFVDVSGHRLGTVWPALFVLSLAMHTAGAPVLRPSRLRWLVPAALGVCGLLLLGAARGAVPLGNSATLAQLKRLIHSGLEQNLFAATLPRVEQALRLAPIDWELHFARGVARALTQPATAPAAADFAAAQRLEPNPAVAFDIGRIWLTRDAEYVERNFFLGREPARAAEVWGALLKRHPDRAPNFFGDMLGLAAGYPEIRPYLPSLAARDERLLLELALFSVRPEFESVFRELLSLDPNLERVPKGALRRLFSHWAREGNADDFERAMEQHPAWLEQGWMGWGEALARRGEFEPAARLGRRFNARASLPVVVDARPLEAARGDYAARPNDPVAILALLQRLLEAGEHAEALRVLAAANRLPGTPAYRLALEADLAFEQRAFERAWQAWQRAATLAPPG